MIQHSIHLENELKAQHQYNCPGCGRSVLVERPVIYEIGDVETQTVKDINSFAIFAHKCRYCGSRFNAVHNFTLIRNSREKDVNFILHFMSDKNMDKAERIFKNHLVHLYEDNDMLIDIDDYGNFINAGYPCRIVRNKMEFSEKSFIFGDKLDDRIIEVLKLMVKEQFEKENPQKKVYFILYNQLKNGRFTWRIVMENESCFYTTPMADYRIAKQVVSNSLSYWNSNGMFIVDEFFAMTLMEICRKHKKSTPAAYAEIRVKSAVVRETEEKLREMEREKERRRQETRAKYYNSGATGYRPAATYGTSGGSSSYTPEGSYGSGDTYGGSSTSYTDGGNPNPGFEFKYDQNRAMTEGGSSGYESYVTPNETYYGNSEYRPMLADGSTVEMYHLDENCSPMSND